MPAPKLMKALVEWQSFPNLLRLKHSDHLLDTLWREMCLEKKTVWLLLYSPQPALNRDRVGNCIRKETAACAKLYRLSSAPISPSSGSYLAPDVLTCQGVWTSALRALLLLSLSPDPLSTAGTDTCTPGFPQTLLEVPLSAFSVCLWPICKGKHKTVGFFLLEDDHLLYSCPNTYCLLWWGWSLSMTGQMGPLLCDYNEGLWNYNLYCKIKK